MGGQGRILEGRILNLVRKESARCRHEKSREIEVPDTSNVLSHLGSMRCVEVTKDGAGLPGNEGPGLSYPGARMLSQRWWQALGGAYGRKSGADMVRFTLVANAEDELEVYSGEKDDLETVGA